MAPDWETTFGPVVEWVQERTRERGKPGSPDDDGFLAGFILIRLAIEYPEIAKGIYERARGDLTPYVPPLQSTNQQEGN